MHPTDTLPAPILYWLSEQAVAYRGKIGRHDPAGEEVHICRFDDRPEAESKSTAAPCCPSCDPDFEIIVHY